MRDVQLKPDRRMRGRWFASALLSLWAGAAGSAQEFRGLWVDAWHAGFKNTTEVQQLLANARAGHFNAVIVEVRKRGDAYYNSRFEPKASDIAGNYDPLADLIVRAHGGTPRIEVHAWIVTYPIWNSQTMPVAADHPANRHPEWFMKNSAGVAWSGDHYQLDPGHPGVLRHTCNVALDIITRYDVDGFHFDYVRYPGRDWGYNEVAVSRFNQRYQRTGQPATTDSAWLQYRRDQVTALVRQVYLSAMAVKPAVKLSAATITWAPGITTDAEWSGTSAYASVLQDWRGWMQEGILDLNIPMAYFRQETYAEDWTEWSTFVKNHRYRRHAALGGGIYLNTLANSLLQIRSLRTVTAAGHRADGFVGFSYAVTSTDATRAAFLNALTQPSTYDANPTPVFDQIVSPPEMSWKFTPQLGYLKGVAMAGRDGEGLDGATVRLAGPSNRSLTADGTGFYGAVDLPPGNYTLTASFTGLVSETGTVAVVAGKVTTRDLSLFPAAGDTFLADIAVAAGARGAVVTWRTAVPATSQVEYGLTSSLGRGTWLETIATTNHSVLLTALPPDAEHFFRVLSRAGTNDYRSSVRSFRTAGQIVVDNPLASYAGDWTLGSSAIDKYAGDYQYAGTASGSPTATATFTPSITTPGYYDVYVWYPQGSNRSASAPFEVAFEGGSVTVRINQTTGGGGWRLLTGNRHFSLGSSGLVRLANNTGEAGKVVLADAVRWVYAANQEPPPPGQVPEWWALHYFGSRVAGAEDSDHDGYPNSAEYVFGTDPTQATARLSCRLQAVNPSGWELVFEPCYTDRLYRLLHTPDLATGGWSLVPNATLTVTPQGEGVLTRTDPALPPGFYRVRAEWAP